MPVVASGAKGMVATVHGTKTHDVPGVSQPSVPPLQSTKPGTHAYWQAVGVPPQRRVVLGRDGQRFAHDPQWSGWVARSTHSVPLPGGGTAQTAPEHEHVPGGPAIVSQNVPPEQHAAPMHGFVSHEALTLLHDSTPLQAMRSEQLRAAPPTHAPDEHASLTVQ